jgi:hypothetical protein
MSSTSTGSLQVIFVSSWEEGEVRTLARLDPNTGEVHDIEASELGDDYQHLIKEYVETLDGAKWAPVIRQESGEDYRLASAEALAVFLNGQGAGPA